MLNFGKMIDIDISKLNMAEQVAYLLTITLVYRDIDGSKANRKVRDTIPRVITGKNITKSFYNMLGWK